MKSAEEILSEKTGMTIDEDIVRIQTKVRYIIEAMHEYAAQDRWVKVSDRLPEVGERVLVYNTAYGVQIGWLMFTGNWEHYTQMLKSEDNTHWQPLPTAPKD